MEENFYSKDMKSRVLEVQKNNILAAKVLADTVSSTFGPMGLDKMLVDRIGNITITNDGATILNEMELDHPVAQMIVKIALNQEAEVGDGTTTTIMIAGKLLENSQKLLDSGIHPTIISKCYRQALEKSKEILKELSFEIGTEKELLKVAETAMTGKSIEYFKEKFSKVVVDAVKIVSEKGKVNKKNIRILEVLGKPGNETQLVNGVVLDRERVSKDMPSIIKNPKILLLDSFVGIKKLESENQIMISNSEEFEHFSKKEEEILKNSLQKIISSSANVLITRDSIDSRIKFYLAREGIYALERVQFEDLEVISDGTGAKIFSSLDDISKDGLGDAFLLEEKSTGSDLMTYILEPKNKRPVTILVSGETEHIAQESRRVIEDALFDSILVVGDSRVLAGGGASEIELSRRLIDLTKNFQINEKRIFEEFTRSLEFIPKTLAENAGMNSQEILNELKKSHLMGNKNHGLNLFSGKIENTINTGIIEPLQIKIKAISNAVEIANSIIRLDDIIASKKSSSGGARTSSMEGLD